MSSESIRRRTRGSTSTNRINSPLPNLLTVPEHQYDFETNSSYSTSSSRRSSKYNIPGPSFLNDDDGVGDVQTDVLFPRFNGNSDQQQQVNLAAFDKMVEDYQRKLSMGSSPVTKTLGRQNRLYSSSDIHQVPLLPKADRFKIYSTQTKTNQLGNSNRTGLSELLSEGGSQVLAQVVNNKGWWLDVVSPTSDEMTVICKTFNIHPLTAEDIEAQEPREKVELFPNYTFVCFRAFYIDPNTDAIKSYNFYNLIFKDGLLTFHFVPSEHCDFVHKRADQLKEYMAITPDWINYALIDSVTDSFGSVVMQVEMESVTIDELSMVLKQSEQPDMLKRISRCRKKSTQIARLLNTKLEAIKNLMKRYEDKSREYLLADLTVANNTTGGLGTTVNEKKAFNDVLLYLGDIQDHILTMVQTISHYDRILHRAHTNYLSRVNLELTQTYNMTNKVMNRLSFLTVVFIPVSLVTGIWGMNVYVPGKSHRDLEWFYLILGGMGLWVTGCAYLGKRIGLL